MKIGVVGCGALGSYYGAKLCRQDHEVHFLLRSDYATVRQRGVVVRSFEGNFTVYPRCAVQPQEIGICDLILIGLKTTANDRFPLLLPPLVGKDSAVLTLQNGLENEASLAQLFGADKVLGGLCFICVNRLEPGVIHHFAHGNIVMGEYLHQPGTRVRNLAKQFGNAGIRCTVTENLEQAHWEKLVWNIPFNGLGVASAAGYEALESGCIPRSWSRACCLTTDRLLAAPEWETMLRELMQEVITTANALGFALSLGLADELIQRTRQMGAYRASTIIDFQRGQPLELEALFGKPLRQARQAGVATPRLRALVSVLRQLDANPPAKKKITSKPRSTV